MTHSATRQQLASVPARSKPPLRATKLRRRGMGPVGAQRATMAALWALVGIGASSGVFALLTRPTVPRLVEARPPAEAEGVGVRFVVSMLTARSRDDLQQTVTAYMGTAAQTPGRVDPRPVEIVSAFPGGWPSSRGPVLVGHGWRVKPEHGDVVLDDQCPPNRRWRVDRGLTSVACG